MTNIKTLKNVNKAKHERHPFHMLSPSPWPICTAATLAPIVEIFVDWLHGVENTFAYVHFWGFSLVFCVYGWFRDIVYEATFEGMHTSHVSAGMKEGFVLFMFTETMFFVSLFWAFFHSALSPSMWIGCCWPPKWITPLCPVGIPLLNTVILLSSGVSVTWAHRAMLQGDKKNSAHSLTYTILLGLLFTYFQKYEYDNAPFAMNDSIYGSVFYMLTGCHGLHVIGGTAFLIVGLVRLMKNHFTTSKHVGFELAAWYWHFVDVVWILVFLGLYCWGA